MKTIYFVNSSWEILVKVVYTSKHTETFVDSEERSIASDCTHEEKRENFEGFSWKWLLWQPATALFLFYFILFYSILFYFISFANLVIN